jgi:hypothetical protein
VPETGLLAPDSQDSWLENSNGTVLKQSGGAGAVQGAEQRFFGTLLRAGPRMQWILRRLEDCDSRVA